MCGFVLACWRSASAELAGAWVFMALLRELCLSEASLVGQAAYSQGVAGYTRTLRLSVHSECPEIEQEQPSCKPLSVS